MRRATSLALAFVLLVSAGTGVVRPSASAQTGSIVIVLQIGSKNMVVDGRATSLDAPPVILEGRTLLPIRAVVEALGGTVAWDAVTQQVTLTLKDTTVILWIGQRAARVNGELRSIDPDNALVVPRIISSRTMLPIRFVAESLGCTVDWGATARTVTIACVQSPEATALADLQVESVTWTPSIVSEGEAVTFSARIANFGKAGSGPFSVAVRVGGRQVAATNLGRLDPQTEVTVVLTPSWTATSGCKTVQVVIDPDNRVVEENEDNNTCNAAEELCPKPRTPDVSVWVDKGSSSSYCLGTVRVIYFKADRSGTATILVRAPDGRVTTIGTYDLTANATENVDGTIVPPTGIETIVMQFTSSMGEYSEAQCSLNVVDCGMSSESGSDSTVIEYLNPRTYTVTYALGISFIGEIRVDRLDVFMPGPRDWSSQRGTVLLDCTPTAASPTKYDPLYGNRYIYYDKASLIDNSLSIVQKYQFTCYETNTSFEGIGNVDGYDESSEEFRLYTRDEPEIETGYFKEIVKGIIGDEKSPVEVCRRIYNFVIDYMTYGVAQPSGAKNVYLAKKGDCGGYSSLFVALARAAGIPARVVVGGWSSSATSQYSNWHVWAEFYLQNIGWIPVDPSYGATSATNRSYYFGNLDNSRYIASKGLNIPLGEYCPVLFQGCCWWWWGGWTRFEEPVASYNLTFEEVKQ